MRNAYYLKNAIAWTKDQIGCEAYPFLCLAIVEDAYEISNTQR